MRTDAHPAALRIGHWSMRLYRRLVITPTLVLGAIAALLTIFRVEPIFMWTTLLALFVVLGFRSSQHRGREIHRLTIGWLVGIPLGASLAILQLIVGTISLDAGVLVEAIALVTFFGIVVTSATGYMLTQPVGVRHLLIGPHKKHHTARL